MTAPPGVRRASELAFLLPLLLLLGANGSQYLGGLYPCEMCLWQRWPHYAAVLVAGAAYFAAMPAKRALVILAALLIATSGAIGAFHAGVEYGWWPGITGCSVPFQAGGGDLFGKIMNAPLVRCDVAPWTLAGISLAGFNAILSLGGALVILMMATRR